MSSRLRLTFACIVTALVLGVLPAHAAQQVLRVGVLDNSPPMAFRSADGTVTRRPISLSSESGAR